MLIFVTLVYIAVFGLVGIFLRYYFETLAASWAVQFLAFDLHGTFAINMVGSFLAGVFYVLGTERHLLPQNLQVGLLVGLCGGFTTFSAYSLKNYLLLEERRPMALFVYMGMTPVMGLALAFCGVIFTRVITKS